MHAVRQDDEELVEEEEGDSHTHFPKMDFRIISAPPTPAPPQCIHELRVHGNVELEDLETICNFTTGANSAFVNGSRVVFLTSPGEFHLWDFKRGEMLGIRPALRYGPLRLCNDGRTLLVRSTDGIGSLDLLDADSQVVLRLPPLFLLAVGTSPNGDWVAYTSRYSEKVLLKNIVAPGGETHDLLLDANRVRSIDFSQDSTKLAILSGYCTVDVCTTQGLPRKLFSFKLPTPDGSSNVCYSLGFSPDGRFLAFHAPWNGLVVLDAGTGDVLMRDALKSSMFAGCGVWWRGNAHLVVRDVVNNRYVLRMYPLRDSAFAALCFLKPLVRGDGDTAVRHRVMRFLL